MPVRYIQKTYKSRNLKFSYWSNCTIDYSRVYILLASGAENGGFFKDLVPKFKNNHLVISIDYPGRGKSKPINKNDVVSVAHEVNNYISKLKLKKKPYLVGFSYGTAIAVEILKINESNFKEVVMIAPGEFIDKKYHAIIKLIFLPAKINEYIRRLYRNLLLKYLPSVFPEFPKNNLKSILQQWLGILDYELNTSIKFTIPCTILAFSHDQLIRKGSIIKIKNMFINSVILLELTDHSLNISKLSKDMLHNLLTL